MLIKYYQCDYCKEKIEDDKKKKFKTKEMGYPFIPKEGGGKHYHYDCLVKHYNKKRLSKKKTKELLEDAVRRHDKHIKDNIKKGTLNKEKFEMRKATKKDRDSLINYFYDYYGVKSVGKNLQSVIDKLNAGEDFGSFRNVYVPYYQLKDMLIYYKKTLSGYYKKRKIKGQMIDPTDRIFFDIVFCVNNIEQYADHNKATYNQAQNISKIDGGESIQDNSRILATSPQTLKKENAQIEAEADMVKEMLKEMEAMEDEE